MGTAAEVPILLGDIQGIGVVVPSTFFVPLRGIRPPALPEHLHAYFSGWFDAVGDAAIPHAPYADAHHATEKPYTISPLVTRHGVAGVEISVLTDAAERQLREAAGHGGSLRLGRQTGSFGVPVREARADWDVLRAGPIQRRWKMTFCKPTTFRTGDRTSPFPSPPVVLRAPKVAWRAFSGLPPIEVSPAETAKVWVSELSLHTEQVEVRARRPEGPSTPRHVPGVVGTITYRCEEPDVADRVGTLFRLTRFCGVGALRGKGFGVVELDAR